MGWAMQGAGQWFWRPLGGLVFQCPRPFSPSLAVSGRRGSSPSSPHDGEPLTGLCLWHAPGG